MVRISIIIPCYNEALNIRKIYERLGKSIAGITHEIIFVNDGSTDSTIEEIAFLAQEDVRVKLLSLSRNFGHQIAITAGIECSSGDYVALIDADLQDPPEIIPKMLEKAEQGYDVVYGKRIKRKGDGVFKRLTAYFFYRSLNYLSQVDIPKDTGDFRIISRSVVEVLKIMPEKERFIRGMISWVGFRQTGFLYVREARHAGETKYPFSKMLKFAIDGITSFSTFPLRLASIAGLFFGSLSMLLLMYQLYQKIFNGQNFVKGWASLIVIILGVASIQFILIGIQGEYISRIFIETKNRPKFIINKKINL